MQEKGFWITSIEFSVYSVNIVNKINIVNNKSRWKI